MTEHQLTQCENSNGWYRHRSCARTGQWQLEYTCPICKRAGKFLRNYLGQRKVYCNGAKFSKLQPQEVTQ